MNKQFTGKYPLSTDRISTKIREQISYILGVPSEYISREKVRNFEELVIQTFKHKTEPSQLEEDLDIEIENFYNEFGLA